MRRIEINIADWNSNSDADILRVVRTALNSSIKYESDRTLNHHHYWNDPNRHVELHITFK